MVYIPLKNDPRLFGIAFVIFNVLLAVYNILNYRITSRTSAPCVVIVAPTPSSFIEEKEPLVLNKMPTISPRIHDSVFQKQSFNSSSESQKLVQKINSNKKVISSSSLLPSEQQTTLDTRVIAKTKVAKISDINSSNTPILTWDTEIRDKYTVIRNYIPADVESPGFNRSVTLCTQGTYEFLDHVQVLCNRWDGPVSVSVYAPGTDLAVAVRKILYLRQCGSPCVSKNVSWHIIYDSTLGPKMSEISTPNDTAEMDVYGPLVNCSAGTDALDLISEIRKSKKMPYPINVARNVARRQARTKYVLASDIELYPSLNIVTRFLKMVAKENEVTTNSRHVYTLPIFEIKKQFSAPETKSELAKQMKHGHAIFFHKWICDACQNFPKRDEWIKYIPENESLSTFFVTKRQQPRKSWEPIYIGTNQEPLYDERLTWEGKRDKMSQMYELCLLDYNFFILDNAFLVHAPGIKTITREDQKRRAPFMVRNNAIHNKLLAEMKKKYGNREGC